MTQKYTILKVLIHHSSKSKQLDKGFTLIELIVGLIIMVTVGGLAMNAFIEASNSFRDDKKNIDSSQNLSAVLEIIGNDIKQAGELISDSNFPTIEFTINTDTGSMANSSKIVIRRTLTDRLTLCEEISANADLDTLTNLVVADNNATTVLASANCDAGSAASQLFVARPNVAYKIPDPVPSPALSLILPPALRNLRDFRCKLDDFNPTVPYEDPTRATEDFCDGVTSEQTRIAVSDQSGHILIFNQTDEAADSTNTATTKKYGMTVNNTFANLADSAIANNTKNKAVAYPIGSPIYVIEERIYTLDNKGNLQLSVNGKAPETLIKRMAHFRVSARNYTNAIDGEVNASPTSDVCPDQAPFADQPSTPTADDPKYICKFNYNTLVGDPAQNWKTIAGVKVELHGQYDGTGQASESSTNTRDIAQVNEAKKKLAATAEFFPRNVLSK